MRAFVFSLLVAAGLALAASLFLPSIQKSSANAYRDPATTRFNDQELLNNYGRQAKPDEMEAKLRSG
jgi:hypothetical protein